MVTSSEDTLTRLKIIEGHLSLIKKQCKNPEDPVIPLLKAAIDALRTSNEQIPLPLQHVLDYLNKINALTTDKPTKDILSQIKQECIQLLTEMLIKNQHRIDS
ncbi:MAG TPA: hypothetical protein PLD88_04675, partial [Candidatus Berkiella sp.]|nr:hypothetical protein [Candidatus Berkiella sp.]